MYCPWYVVDNIPFFIFFAVFNILDKTVYIYLIQVNGTCFIVPVSKRDEVSILVKKDKGVCPPPVTDSHRMGGIICVFEGIFKKFLIVEGYFIVFPLSLKIGVPHGHQHGVCVDLDLTTIIFVSTDFHFNSSISCRLVTATPVNFFLCPSGQLYNTTLACICQIKNKLK